MVFERLTIFGLGATLALTLSACSPPAETGTAPSPPVVPSPAEMPSPPPAPRPGQLTVLSSADIEAAKLGGELGCSFSSPAGGPLMVAMGDVASAKPSQGVVNFAGKPEQVSAPGGFDAMSKGVVFTNPRLTLTVAVTGPATGGGESPPRPATLTLEGAGLAREELVGSWTCGP